MSESDEAIDEHPFDGMDGYLALPRVSDLALSADGTRLVAVVAELNQERDKFVSALWEIDPAGVEPARRLTRSARGENAPVFAEDGSLLFVSNRGDADDDPAALWRLPAGAGEAHRVLVRPGGIAGAVTARAADTVVVAAAVLAGSDDVEDEKQRRAARKKAKVGAILHTGTPVRYWDHDLGPDEAHLLVVTSSADGGDADGRDLTPEPGRALDEAGVALTPDGRTLVTSWAVFDEPGYPRSQLIAIDTATGTHRVLCADPTASFEQPAVSPDGRWAVCVRGTDSTYDEPPREQLWLVELASGDGRALIDDADVRPAEPVFSAEGDAVFFTADERGHRPVFRVGVGDAEITRMTRSGHYAGVRVSPDGRSLYALRDDVDAPPAPVRLQASATDSEPTPLRAPGAVTVPGRIEEVLALAADGTPLRAWLALPEAASADAPAPLLLWIHGGPLSSWNSWSWRWNPWLMVARGYAVLLPDPALSTGYGHDMIRRGWGRWGDAPFTDLMTMTDATVARADIDEQTTAAMGGSFGGYMANWVAGHTGRFRCIVTHASLWAIDAFNATTDVPGYWTREWGLPLAAPQRYEQWSPHRFADAIGTPMLVIHGDKDYRVPVGEALRLWWDLQRYGVESTYLYFPDEGHWILKPGNARVWYETVWAFLDQHLHGKDWRTPELLGGPALSRG